MACLMESIIVYVKPVLRVAIFQCDQSTTEIPGQNDSKRYGKIAVYR